MGGGTLCRRCGEAASKSLRNVVCFKSSRQRGREETNLLEQESKNRNENRDPLNVAQGDDS